MGVWAWSRHPNFFGEMALWWGLYLSALNDLRGAEHAAVVGPIFITLLLLFVSGVPILEKSADARYAARADYREYKRRTSVLIPLPPSLYARLPTAVKTTLLLDMKLFNPGPPPQGADTPMAPPATEDSALVQNDGHAIAKSQDSQEDSAEDAV